MNNVQIFNTLVTVIALFMFPLLLYSIRKVKKDNWEQNKNK